ncbi:hypothetical protein [Rhizobium sp. BE258]|uniref:hypothetical protein n=1 Tax=Rhizobium sp. BE258 TaxID=2817722 RepID=UPI002866A705|nr:hypothetical protein [Rhizobium sp. BE258]MDR7145222.1 hypothetical protein [Rhizobium sp. BE258]
MSVKFKALVVAINVSLLMWGAIIYGGMTLFNTALPNVDPMATASVETPAR